MQSRGGGTVIWGMVDGGRFLLDVGFELGLGTRRDRASPRDQEGYDGDRELPPVATGSGDWDRVAIRVLKLKCHSLTL